MQEKHKINSEYEFIELLLQKNQKRRMFLTCSKVSQMVYGVTSGDQQENSIII